MTIPEVAYTAEVQRIASLSRRSWSPEDLASLTAELTSLLRTPAGATAGVSLRPVQALALHDAGTEGGLFGPIGVGEGKTLTSFLLPVALGAERPLLLEPGGLIEKTQRERLALSRHWQIPSSLRIMSYDLLGRVQSADELDSYQPDALICDEVHRLKNLRSAAVTRRVARYMHDRPQTKFCGLSGTVMGTSLKDFAHILLWCLKWGAPVPTTREEIEEWAQALDENVEALSRRKPGALLSLGGVEGADAPPHIVARRAFRKRLTETPGVVATVGEGEHVDCSIYLRGIRHKVAPVTEANFLKLRQEWCTPDDWELMEAVDIWRHAQELALGLFYVWDPRPPEAWRAARRNWNAFVRATISRSRTFDSELHVANACDEGRLDATDLNKWREVKPTFTPNVVPVWCDTSALDTCRDWMRHKSGLVWTEHNFFAERLAAHASVRYYGAGGFAADGAYIEDARLGESAIASLDANREGKNLQGIWSRNLIVCPPGRADWMEQIIARTHRPGQKADEVIVDVLLGCRENFDSITKALAGAAAIKDMTGKMQKLLLADVTLPSEAEIEGLRSPRWTR